MYGYSIENTDLTYRNKDVGKEARVVRVWRDIDAEYNYKLYHLYKGFFRRTVWIESYCTASLSKAKRWAEHHGIEIEE